MDSRLTMNILVFSWRGPGHPLSGGAEQVMHEHMKGWVEAGHTVTLLTSFFANSKDNEILDGVNIIRKGNQYLTVHIAGFFWYLFAKHQKFDVVVDQFHGWPFFTPLYVRVPKLAVIQELTRKVWFRYPLPYGLNYILGTLGYILEPIFFLFYKNTAFMTGSHSAKEELQTVGIKKDQITIVPHGIIVDLPQKLPKKEIKPTVLFLGALASDKGIEDALKTFGLINEKLACQFWVVGKGEGKYLDHLKKLAKKLGLENNITFFGFVSQKKKFELLARAHVILNPSIREGWGLVNIEANAFGTPVVAYKSPGLVDSVKDGVSGIIVSENSPWQMAAATCELLLKRDKLAKLAHGARNWSKSFSWGNSKKLSLKLIESL